MVMMDCFPKLAKLPGLLTQIWNATDTFFCHFRSFFALLLHYWPQKLKSGKNVKNTWIYYPFTHVHHKSRSHNIWLVRYKVQFYVILGHFSPFDPTNNPKNQNFEKIKTTPGDIINLHLCNTNNDHMMYGSWDIKHNRHNFL